MSSTNVTVSFKDTVLKNGPAILSFPASYPSNEANLKYEMVPLDPEQKRRVLLGKTELCTYVGKEKHINDLDGSRYYLGVFNKRKRKLDVHNIDSFFSMRLRFEGERGTTDPSVVTKNNKKVLVDRFSSSKRQRKQTRKLAAIITDDNVAAESHVSRIVDSEAAKARAKDNAAKATLRRRMEVLPKFDEEAKLPHQVYPLEFLAPKRDTKCLTEDIERIKSLVQSKNGVEAATSSKSKTKWSKYIAKHMELLASSVAGVVLSSTGVKGDDVMSSARASGKVLSRKVVLLAHLRQYLRFHKGLRKSQQTTKREIQSKTKIPKSVLGRMLQKFAVVSAKSAKISIERTPIQTDRLLYHIFALCLHIDDFKCNPALIALDVNLTPNKCIEYFRQMGCSISRRSDQVKICSLSTPVTFPQPKSKARAARR